MMNLLAILVGGALGSAARHAVNLGAARALGTSAPYATATVNLVGSLVVGLLAGAVAAERLSMTTTMRAFVFVGVLGGFTTFSSYMLDSLALLETGRSVTATFNLVGQVVLGLALVFTGYQLGLRLR